jgi:hypothetical protein
VLRFDYDEGLRRMPYVIKDKRMEEVYQPRIRLLAELEDNSRIPLYLSYAVSRVIISSTSTASAIATTALRSPLADHSCEGTPCVIEVEPPSAQAAVAYLSFRHNFIESTIHSGVKLL